nr:DNA cytosine methyltransferase [Amycolatopsis rubida]
MGGPPCTPFSKSGFWLDWKRAGLDPAASLLQEFTRVLREARPRGFVLENVAALTFDNRASRPAFRRLLAEADAAGYKHAWKVLNAADFGVAQSRQRLFVAGVLKSEKTTPELPAPGFGGTRNRRAAGDPEKSQVTAGQALEGLTAGPEPADEVAGRYGRLLPGIPPGGNYLHYTAERGHPAPLFRWRSRYWSFLLKLDPDRPSPTIQAQPGPYTGPFHWENRHLRIPELKDCSASPTNSSSPEAAIPSSPRSATPFPPRT